MKKPEIYEVETKKSITEVFGASIDDVKNFVENNKEQFNLDMSGQFNVNTSSNDYQIDVEFIDEDNDKLHAVNSIDVENITLGTTNFNALYTSNAELFLIKENKERLKKLTSQLEN